MELAKTCYLCEFYVPTVNKGVGLCVRVDDFCFHVPQGQDRCSYDNPGCEISEDKIKARDWKYEEDFKRHREAMKRASEMAASWPEWKRRMADQIFSPRPSS